MTGVETTHGQVSIRKGIHGTRIRGTRIHSVLEMRMTHGQVNHSRPYQRERNALPEHQFENSLPAH